MQDPDPRPDPSGNDDQLSGQGPLPRRGVRYRNGARGLYVPSTEHDACGIGFVVNIKGNRSRRIVQQALEVLRRLSHRSAVGADPRTGDGAGILVQLPHAFFNRVTEFELPKPGRYGVAQVFLPRDPTECAACIEIIDEAVQEEGQRILGWRDVPVDPEHVGRVAGAVRPIIRQVFIEKT